jgi:thiamine pyrophosphate-dependent acetolactate synthase large subunit-like protein
LIGDAAFKMCGFDLHTASEHDIPLKVLVLNDLGHGMVEAGVTAQWGSSDGRYRFRSPVQAARAATALGVSGVRARTEAELREALTLALGTPGPSLVEVAVDPQAVPPIGSRTDMLARSFAPKEAP